MKATVWASRADQVFGWICIAGGLYVFFLTRDWTWLWFAQIGWFLAGSATAEAQQAVLASPAARHPGQPGHDAGPGHGAGVDNGQRVHRGLPVPRAPPVLPGDRGRRDTVTGLVTLDRIKHVPASQRDRTRLADIACPLADIATASPEDSVADILPRLTECAGCVRWCSVMGHLAGIITPSDITQMIDRLGLLRSP